MDTKTYGKAYRAAFAITKQNHEDVRIAKDEAHAIGSTAAMVAEGSLDRSDLKQASEPAMVAALAAVQTK